MRTVLCTCLACDHEFDAAAVRFEAYDPDAGMSDGYEYVDYPNTCPGCGDEEPDFDVDDASFRPHSFEREDFHADG